MSIDYTAPTTSLSYQEYTADLVVARREDVADDVVALTLADPSGQHLPEWTPGAHIDVEMPDVDLTRQYSLCGGTHERGTWRIGVLRVPDSRGGSKYVHSTLQPGTPVRVRGPRNHFPFLASPRYLFIAGGIGITPLLPMIVAAETAGAQWELHYGGRRRDTLAFLPELQRHGARVHIYAHDEVGSIDITALLSEPRTDTLIYCCGPGGLLEAAEAASAHWPQNSFHAERFTPKLVEASPNALETFQVVCQRSGITLQIPADQSILDVAERAGLNVLSSCREGTCGTCEQDIVEGTADHRDSILSEEEQDDNESLMICVSRSLTPTLVLDI